MADGCKDCINIKNFGEALQRVEKNLGDYMQKTDDRLIGLERGEGEKKVEMKTLFKYFDELKASIKDLGSEIKDYHKDEIDTIRHEVKEIAIKVDEIEKKPAKRFDLIVTAGITAAVTVLVTVIVTNMVKVV